MEEVKNSINEKLIKDGKLIDIPSILNIPIDMITNSRKVQETCLKKRMEGTQDPEVETAISLCMQMMCDPTLQKEYIREYLKALNIDMLCQKSGIFNPYLIFRIPTDASTEQIEQTFAQITAFEGPKNPQDIYLINMAKDILTNPLRRKGLDNLLANPKMIDNLKDILRGKTNVEYTKQNIQDNSQNEPKEPVTRQELEREKEKLEQIRLTEITSPSQIQFSTTPKDKIEFTPLFASKTNSYENYSNEELLTRKDWITKEKKKIEETNIPNLRRINEAIDTLNAKMENKPMMINVLGSAINIPLLKKKKTENQNNDILNLNILLLSRDSLIQNHYDKLIKRSDYQELLNNLEKIERELYHRQNDQDTLTSRFL